MKTAHLTENLLTITEKLMMKETVGYLNWCKRFKKSYFKKYQERNSKSHEKNKLVESMNNKDNVIGL
jgi:hypothetical protein